MNEPDLLRHTLATLAYRGAKALRDAPADFAGFRAGLRRLHGSPIRGENYFRAEIETGRVGRDQPAPVRELD